MGSSVIYLPFCVLQARGALIGPSAGSLQGGAATGGRRQSTSSTSSQSSSGSSAITPRVLELVNEVHAWAEKVSR